MRFFISLWLAVQALFVPAAAQDFPTKPVRLIVPFAPGGVADIIGRLMAAPMAKALGGSVYVENRAGAGGLIGTEELANSSPDGYSLVITDMAFTISAWVYPRLPYDPIKSFTPVSLVAKTPQWLFVSATSPVKSIDDLVAMAKKNPGKFTIGSSGNGTGTHMMAELLKREAGIDLTHVPYKGAGPSVTAAVTGEIDAVFAFMPVAASFVAAGRLRPIAVTTEARVASYSDVPTFKERGFQNMVVEHWLGLMAPADLPTPVLNKLNAAIKVAIQDPTLEQRFKSLVLEPVTSSPTEFRGLVRSDLTRWEAVVRAANIKIQ